MDQIDGSFFALVNIFQNQNFIAPKKRKIRYCFQILFFPDWGCSYLRHNKA